MCPIGHGPPPSVGLEIGAAKDTAIPIPDTIEDCYKAQQIAKHFAHLKGKPWFNDFLLKYPQFQEVASEFYRLADGMGGLGAVLLNHFNEGVEQAKERQRLQAAGTKIITP
jgi:hypothetical protein